MTNITSIDIDNLADLAKLELNTLEKESYKKDIQNILGYISMITNADVSKIEPMYNFHSVSKEDVILKSEEKNSEKKNFDLNIIMQNIPKLSKDNFVEVSKVLKNK